MKTNAADGLLAVKAVPTGPQSGTRHETGQFRSAGTLLATRASAAGLEFQAPKGGEGRGHPGRARNAETPEHGLDPSRWFESGSPWYESGAEGF